MIRILRRPDGLTRTEWATALADLQTLGLLHVHIMPSDRIDGAVVEVLRLKQPPKLVVQAS